MIGSTTTLNPWTLFVPMVSACLVVAGWILLHIRNHVTKEDCMEHKKDTNERVNRLSDGVVYEDKCIEVIHGLRQSIETTQQQCSERHEDIKTQIMHMNTKLDNQMKLLINIAKSNGVDHG